MSEREKSLLEELAEIGEEVTEERPVIEHIDGQTKLIPDEIVWRGAEALRPYLVPINSLADHERNPNKGDVFAISASLDKYGQVRAILHDNGIIVAGHHVRAAAQVLEWTHIAALPHTFDSDEARTAYLLVDNQIAKKSVIDSAATYGIIMDLEAAGYAEVPGFDIDDKETLQAKAGLTPVSQGEEWEETAGESPEAAAARAAAIAQYEQHREVVLLLSYPEQYEEFGRHVRALMAAYNTTGTVATIVRAVGEAAVVAAAREVPSDDAPF
jgi:ParB-like chromosome segregation protein Spo0J